MIVKKLDCKITISNVPESIVHGSRTGFIVARVDLPNLWYYGCYDTFERATEVAMVLGNGIVVEVSNDCVDETD